MAMQGISRDIKRWTQLSWYDECCVKWRGGMDQTALEYSSLASRGSPAQGCSQHTSGTVKPADDHT